MSLALLLSTELACDVERGHEVLGLSAPGPYVERVEQLGVRHVPLPSLTRAWSLRRDARAARELWASLRRAASGRPPHPQPEDRGPGPGARPGRRGPGRGQHLPRALGRTRRPVAASGSSCWRSRPSPPSSRTPSSTRTPTDRRALRWAVPGRRAQVVGNGVDLARFRFDAAGPRAGPRRSGASAPTRCSSGASAAGWRRRACSSWRPPPARWRDGPASSGWAPRIPTRPTTSTPRPSPRSSSSASGRTCPPSTRPSTSSCCRPTARGSAGPGMEAAACGRPMVLTDIRGCREVGAHEEHLLLVPPRAPDALDRRHRPPPRRRRLAGTARPGCPREGTGGVRPAAGGRGLAGHLPGRARTAAPAERPVIRRAVDLAVAATAARRPVAPAGRARTPRTAPPGAAGAVPAAAHGARRRGVHDRQAPHDARRALPGGAGRRPHARGWGASSGRRASTSCPSCGTCSRGEMSLIGPRPTLPGAGRALRPARARPARRSVPGSPAGRRSTAATRSTWPERIELDLWYIEHRSLRLDLQILCADPEAASCAPTASRARAGSTPASRAPAATRSHRPTTASPGPPDPGPAAVAPRWSASPSRRGARRPAGRRRGAARGRPMRAARRP